MLSRSLRGLKLPKTRVKMDCTIDFVLTLKPSVANVEIIDETDEGDVLELSWNDQIAMGKISIILSSEDLKRVLKVSDG